MSDEIKPTGEPESKADKKASQKISDKAHAEIAAKLSKGVFPSWAVAVMQSAFVDGNLLGLITSESMKGPDSPKRRETTEARNADATGKLGKELLSTRSSDFKERVSGIEAVVITSKADLVGLLGLKPGEAQRFANSILMESNDRLVVVKDANESPVRVFRGQYIEGTPKRKEMLILDRTISVEQPLKTINMGSLLILEGDGVDSGMKSLLMRHVDKIQMAIDENKIGHAESVPSEIKPATDKAENLNDVRPPEFPKGVKVQIGSPVRR